MAYIAFTDSEIEVSKAIKQELFQKMKDNFQDHEDRLVLTLQNASKIEVLNADVRIGSYASGVTGIIYHEALQDMTLVECAIQIFDKNGISAGILSIDVKKNSTPNNVGMATVFTTAPSINFATALDYARDTATFNLNQTVVKGEILRLDIISLPVGIGSFRIILIGEV